MSEEAHLDTGGEFDDLFGPKVFNTSFKDANGDAFPMHIIDGVHYGQFTRPKLHELIREEFEVRKDDIWLVSYPRAGQHWMWNILYRMSHNLQEAPKGLDERCEPEHVQNAMASIPSRRIVRCHMRPQFLPQDVFKNKCKTIHLLRHPKDVAYSWYTHIYTANSIYAYDGKWDGFFPNFLNGEVPWGSWFSHTKLWLEKAREHEICFLTFEECKQDIIGTLKKVAAFLDYDFTEEQYKDLAEATSMENIRSRNKEYDAYCRDGKGYNFMYRKGEVGGWKEHFTIAQSEQFNKVYKTEMKNVNIPYTDCLE